MSNFKLKKPWCKQDIIGHSVECVDQEDADGWTARATRNQISDGDEDSRALGVRPFMLLVVNTLAVMGVP